VLLIGLVQPSDRLSSVPQTSVNDGNEQDINILFFRAPARDAQSSI
jgi:hypothetical protein